MVHLGDHRFNTTIQQKAFFRLLGLQYTILCEKGSINKAADALSRRPTDDSELNAISAVYPRWLEIVTEGYAQNTQDQQLLSELSVHSPNEQGFSLQNGLIRHNGKIWLGHHKEAQQAVLQALHNSGLGGHSGVLPTFHKIKQMFS